MTVIAQLSKTVEEIYTPKIASCELWLWWNLIIFLKYSESISYATFVYDSYFSAFRASPSFSPFISFLRSGTWKQFEISMILPSFFPKITPITTGAWLLSNSLLIAWSKRFGKICGWIMQWCCLAVAIPKLRFASIEFGFFSLILSIFVFIVFCFLANSWGIN